MLPDVGGSMSQKLASLNILVHDVINLLWYEHRTETKFQRCSHLTQKLMKLEACPEIFSLATALPPYYFGILFISSHDINNSIV